MSQANNNPISDNLPVPLGTTISDLARRSGLSRTTVRRRLRNGWTPSDLIAIKSNEIPQCVQGLSTPVQGARPGGGRYWLAGIMCGALGLLLAAVGLTMNAQYAARFGPTADETFAL